VIRFNAKLGAAALVLGSALYMVASMVTSRSARAEIPPDLSANPAETSLDVMKTAAALVQEGRSVIVDVRPAGAYARFHVPGAILMPGAGPKQMRVLLRKHAPVIVYASKDELAQRLVAEVRRGDPMARIHYLADGARAWYLTFQLPVPLFTESSPPAGYADALQLVSAWFAGPGPRPEARAQTVEALQTLTRLNYQPSLLKSDKKAAAAGGGKKKIGGGCG
jgi:rhodanese-related sulfurtransferase